MKKFSKFLASLVAVLMMLVGTGITAFADPVTTPTPGQDTKYTPVEGNDDLEFQKFLITNAGQTIPDMDFKYTIEPGKAVPASDAKTYYEEVEEGTEGAIQADGTTQKNKEGVPFPEGTWVKSVTEKAKFEVFAGIGTPTMNDAKFGETDPRHHEKYDTIQAGDSLKPELLTDGKVYSKDTVTVDFTGITFEEPGIYRYIITEQELTDPSIEAIEYDIETNRSMKRVLDVYVIDNGQGVLEIQEYVLHETETTVYTTENAGSKDENIVATAWAISDDLTKTYPTKEAAEEELDKRKSTSPTPTHHDQSIVDKQQQIDDKQAAIDEKQSEYDTKASQAGIPQKEAAVQEIKDRIKVLEDGTDPKPSESIEDLLEGVLSHPYYELDPDQQNPGIGAIEITDENQDELLDEAGNPFTIGDWVVEHHEVELKKYGRNELYDYLVVCTDAYEITELRKVIGELDAAIASAKTELANAESELAVAKAPLTALLNEIAQLKAEKKDLEEELQQLVAKHNAATVVELVWKLKDKSDHYTNRISTYNLEFGKEVEGNQGSKDKYFKFTLTLEGLRKRADEKWTFNGNDYETEQAAQAALTAWNNDHPDNPKTTADILHVPAVEPSVIIVHSTSNHTKTITDGNKGSSTKYDADDMTEANSRDDDTSTDVQQLKASDDGVITWDVYLKDGEYIVLKDLPSGITYKVEEVAEDYKKTDGTTKEVTGVKEYVFNGNKYESRAAAEAAAIATIVPDDPENPTKWTYDGVDYATKEAAEAAARNDVEEKNKVHDDATTGELTKNIYTGYTNTRDGILPTGIMIAATAGLAMLGIGAAGMFLFGKRKEEDEEEDEE